ncbi:MAG: hypothetical protein ABIR51_02035 [Sphingomicrobium sp.]
MPAPVRKSSFATSGLKRCALALALVITPVAATAQVFVSAPDFRGPPVTGSEPGIVLPIPGATPLEYSAAMLWNLRAGLNVAALQCQAMPLVDAVENYNAMLVNHGPEMKIAYNALIGYFTRTLGPAAGIKAFDLYNTRTYNGFSSLYALLGFCHAAGLIGRDVMFAPRGTLFQVAQNRMQEFRNSLIPAADRFWITPPLYVPAPVLPRFPAKCYGRDGEVKNSCLR